MKAEIARVAVGIAAVTIFAGGCWRGNAGEAGDSDLPPRVIAVVNGSEILESEFQAFLNATRGELGDDPSPVPVAELFEDFLTYRLLLQRAEKQGITIGEGEVEKFVTEWTPRDGVISPRFSDHIYEYLLTQKVLKEEALQGLSVTLREVQAYYEANDESFHVEDHARVLEILTETRAEADRIRSDLEESDISGFKEMARQNSVGVTAQSGGSLGLYGKGELPEEFEKVIFSLKPGEISEPFRSAYGYHLFALEESIPGHAQKFYEVRDQIFETLMALKEREAVELYIAGLFENADIHILDHSLITRTNNDSEIQPDESTLLR